MPARKLISEELELCVEAIAAKNPGRARLAPGPADYEVLETDRYFRVFIRDVPDAQIVGGTRYNTWVVNLAAGRANVVGQFRSERRPDGGDDTVAPLND